MSLRKHVQVASTIIGLLALAVTSALANAPGQILYQETGGGDEAGYGRVIRLQHSGAANGRLLSTFEHFNFNAGAQPAIIRQSTDDGHTWTTIANVFDPQGSNTIWTPELYEFPVALGPYPAGTLALVLNAIEPGNPNLSEFKMFHSTDNGATWTYSNTFEVGRNDQHGVWEPCLNVDAQGRLICYFSDERQAPTYSQFLNAIPSTDGGDHWGAEFPVLYVPGSQVRPGMPSVVKLPNGTYILAYENGGLPGAYQIFTKTSTDGINFGNLGDFGTPVVTTDGRFPSGSPQMIWSPQGGSNGTLVLSAQVFHLSSNGANAPEDDQALMTSTTLGHGAWNWTPAPFLANISDSEATANYSPSLALSTDGLSVREVTKSGDERSDSCNAGILPYTGPFAGGGDQGWVDYGGTWNVSGGVYNNVSGGAGDKAIAGSTGWTDYTLTGDIRLNTAGEGGFLVRASNPDVGIDSLDGYYIGLSSATGALFCGKQNYGWTQLGSANVSGGIALNTWYHITIQATGGKLIISATPSGLEQATTLTVNDSSFLSGAIGVRVVGAQASFRTITASGPGGSSTGGTTGGGGGTTGTTGGGATPPATVGNGVYEIVAKTTGNVLDCTGCSNAPGTPVQLWTPWGGNCQQWAIAKLGTGAYSIRNINADGSLGLSLDCTGCSPNNGTPMELWGYWGGPCQQWNINGQADGFDSIATALPGADVLDGTGCSGAAGTPVQLWSWSGGGCQQEWSFQPIQPPALVNGAYYTLTNVAANLNIDDPNGSNTWGTKVQLFSANGAIAQAWKLTKQADGSYTLTNEAAGLNLDDPNAAGQGTLQQLWPANGATAQEWKISGAPNGAYTLTNVATGLNLDDPNGSGATGTNLQLYPSNGATAQQWRLTPQ